MNNLTRCKALLSDQVESGRADVFDSGVNVAEFGIAMGGKLDGGQTLGTGLVWIAQLVKLAFQVADSKHR
jgi:hypothetical protein